MLKYTQQQNVLTQLNELVQLKEQLVYLSNELSLQNNLNKLFILFSFNII
jgi:hypothetical protein